MRPLGNYRRWTRLAQHADSFDELVLSRLAFVFGWWRTDLAHPSGAKAPRTMNTIGWPNLGCLNQEGIVFAIAVVVFVAAAIGLPASSIRTISSPSCARCRCWAFWRSAWPSSLSAGASTCLPWRSWRCRFAWYLQLLNSGTPDGLAFVYVLAGVLAIGLLNGILVAYAEVPAIFVTARHRLLRLRLCPFATDHAGRRSRCRQGIGSNCWAACASSMSRSRSSSSPAGFPVLPVPALHQMGPLHLLRSATIRLRRATSAFPCGPMLVLRYVLSCRRRRPADRGQPAFDQHPRRQFHAALRHRAGGGDRRQIGCSGGRGGVRNVLVGAALIGILLNAMTIIDIPLLFTRI